MLVGTTIIFLGVRISFFVFDIENYFYIIYLKKITLHLTLNAAIKNKREYRNSSVVAERLEGKIRNKVRQKRKAKELKSRFNYNKTFEVE